MLGSLGVSTKAVSRQLVCIRVSPIASSVCDRPQFSDHGLQVRPIDDGGPHVGPEREAYLSKDSAQLLDLSCLALIAQYDGGQRVDEEVHEEYVNEEVEYAPDQAADQVVEYAEAVQVRVVLLAPADRLRQFPGPRQEDPAKLEEEQGQRNEHQGEAKSHEGVASGLAQATSSAHGLVLQYQDQPEAGEALRVNLAEVMIVGEFFLRELAL